MEGVNMYLKREILPQFTKWLSGIGHEICDDDAMKYARDFLKNYVDPKKAGTRGGVYDLFEDVHKYAKMKKLLYAGQMSADEHIKTNNLETVSEAVTWAVQHDAFDVMKYDPITHWGKDITAASM